MINGGIQISPEKMKHHSDALEKRKALEKEMKKNAGMVPCPLLNKYGTNPTIAQLSTWAVHRADCMCGHVTLEKTTGKTDELVNQQIMRWAHHVKSGAQFAA